MATKLDVKVKEALFEYLQRLGDDLLVVGHRLSEWCGHAPILEEDIALANISLDCLGEASAILALAGQIEGKGRDEDALAYFRFPLDFRCSRLVELTNGDFAYTICRQFLFDAYAACLYGKLQSSSHSELSGIAAKAYKEVKYHLRHTSQWMLRLGDGTAESHERLQSALNDLWRFTPELFLSDASESILVSSGLAPDSSSLKTPWDKIVREVIEAATLVIPELPASAQTSGVRRIYHTEFLGHLLTDMQSVARAFPGASW